MTFQVRFYYQQVAFIAACFLWIAYKIIMFKRYVTLKTSKHHKRLQFFYFYKPL